MTRRPARYGDHPAMAEEAGPQGESRVDSWIEAARARERTDRPEIERRRGASDLDTLAAAAAASERRAIETASRTAAALGSVASWIERAQEQLNETSLAAARAQDQAAAVLNGAVDQLGDRLSHVERRIGQESSAASEALAAIERIEGRLTSAASSRTGLDANLKAFEARLGEVNERLASVPRPIGRRGMSADEEVANAVAEIRQHRASLEREPDPAEAARPILPALGTLARSQTALLSTMRADIAKLSSRLETASPAGASEELSHDVETIRDSLGGLATRDDLARLERGIRSLTTDIADLRRTDPGSPAATGLAALQAEIRRLGESRTATDGAGRDIEILSHKLDLVAASGVDPSIVSSLAHQVDEVRRLLTEAAAPQALSLVNAHLDDLRREVAEVGGRQVAPHQFASLQSAIDDIRGAVSELRPAENAAPEAMRAAVRDLGQPLETMLARLAEKVERIEQRIADPDALDGLQHQIEALTARMAATPSSDLGIASLERAMGDLMREVGTWREGAIEAAETAARAVARETIGAMPAVPDVERHLLAIRAHYEAAEARTTESLATVHGALESVVRRMASLEGIGPTTRASAPELPSMAAAPASASPRVAAEPPRVAAEPPRRRGAPPQGRDETDVKRDPLQDSLHEPLAPTRDEDEILLEPGAGRPSRASGSPDAPSTDEAASLDGADIRSSFIAAARRAAQAAQTESGGAKKKEKARKEKVREKTQEKAARGVSATPADILGRIRRLIAEKRRPLLLSAAAIVIALGALQSARTLLGSSSNSTPTRQAIAPSLPPPPQAAPAPLAPPSLPGIPAEGGVKPPFDPITTQAIGERRPLDRLNVINPSEDARRPAPGPLSSAGPEKDGGRMDVAAAPAPATTPAPLNIARAPVVSPEASPLPANLRQAANGGNPVALFDLAARTADGRGVARDPKAALALFERAADRGFAPAQYRVGNIYERGVGITRDPEGAKTWYRRAAEAGNVRAMHNLAVLIAEGSGQKPDYPTAVGWFTKAAGLGVRDSQFNLAVLHARGLGTPADLAKSYVWLAIAAASGDEDAGKKRDEVGARLSATDLARAKDEVSRFKPGTPNPAANEVQVPAEGWPDTAPVKRASRDTRSY